jgi:hypothetical protein
LGYTTGSRAAPKKSNPMWNFVRIPKLELQKSEWKAKGEKGAESFF